jgi:hypothetical protein
MHSFTLLDVNFYSAFKVKEFYLIWVVIAMRRSILIILLLVMTLNFTGCKNTAKTEAAGKTADAGAQSKVPDNLKLVSLTKISADDILYVYVDQVYHTEVYVCKNLKSNTVSISTNK